MKILRIGYKPDEHQRLKQLGHEVTSIDPNPVTNYYWVKGSENKEKMFKRAFYEKEMHHVFVGTYDEFRKMLPNNRYDRVDW